MGKTQLIESTTIFLCCVILHDLNLSENIGSNSLLLDKKATSLYLLRFFLYGHYTSKKVSSFLSDKMKILANNNLKLIL